jgi:hypothetical protein
VLEQQRAAAGLARDEFDVMSIGETRSIVPNAGGERK